MGQPILAAAGFSAGQEALEKASAGRIAGSPLAEREMPTLSTFYGILIRMYFNDHRPPHFHARYGEFEATIDIHSLSIQQGELPRRALDLVLEWAMIHKAELLEDWRLCSQKTPPQKIDPLA